MVATHDAVATAVVLAGGTHTPQPSTVAFPLHVPVQSRVQYACRYTPQSRHVIWSTSPPLLATSAVSLYVQNSGAAIPTSLPLSSSHTFSTDPVMPAGA